MCLSLNSSVELKCLGSVFFVVLALEYETVLIHASIKIAIFLNGRSWGL